jgi:heme exporter protein A
MLTVKSLACRRGRRLLFRGLDFTLGAGGLLLVTGRNGSGKSSLLRLLAGLLPAYEGDILWQDGPVSGQHVHYLGHLDALKPELTVAETIRYWRTLYQQLKGKSLDLFGFAELQDTPVRYLSVGQKRRLALMRLTIHEAPLWLLDEPSTALDDKGQTVLTNLIARHRARDGLAIIATHQSADYADGQKLSLDGDYR